MFHLSAIHLSTSLSAALYCNFIIISTLISCRALSERLATRKGVQQSEKWQRQDVRSLTSFTIRLWIDQNFTAWAIRKNRPFFSHQPKTSRRFVCEHILITIFNRTISSSLQLSQMELQGFYGHDTDSLTGSDGIKPSFLLHSANKPTTPTLKFHNHFPPDVATWVKIECDPTFWDAAATSFVYFLIKYLAFYHLRCTWMSMLDIWYIFFQFTFGIVEVKVVAECRDFIVPFSCWLFFNYISQ